MKLHAVISKKTNRKGYRGRYTDPISGERKQHTEWFSDRRMAEDAWKIFLDNLNARATGLPDNSGWKLPYSVIVERFIAEAPITTDRRRNQLESKLQHNLLGMVAGADFTNKGTLAAKARKLAQEHGTAYVARWIQAPLKQVSAWAASIGLFPYDPLHSWKRLPITEAPARRQAFSPDEIRAILAAADDMDALLDRPYPPAIVFKTMLVTGNRPGALFAAKVKDLRGDRIQLPAGHGNKHNGRCMIPARLAAELARYVALRQAGPADPLLVGPQGECADRWRTRDIFRRAAILAFVRMKWPQDNPHTAHTNPVEVALAIYAGKLPGFDGAPAKKTDKLAAREARQNAVKALVQELQPHIDSALENRPMYALRHTHISWARAAGVNVDSIKAQVGHRGGDIEELHYLDARIVDPAASSQAVYEILTGSRELAGAKRLEALPLAAGAENMVTVVATVDEKKPSGVRSGFLQVLTTQMVGDTGLEPVTPSLSSWCSSQLS